MAISLGELIFTLGIKDAQFKRDLTKSEKSMVNFAKTSKTIGGNLTKNLTLPIVGLGVAALKMAADFEVADKKFTAVFGNMEDGAESVKILNEQYGLSIGLSTKLLANTGDLVKGFGASSAEALSMSTETQKLAAALAAMNGVPVARASAAITSALVGEREALKSLGIVVSEEAVKRQLEINGTADLTGEKLLLAKANATLAIATSQSGGAIDNFQDNLLSTNSQLDILKGQFSDLAIEFGTAMLPMFNQAIDKVSELVKKFSEMSEEEKEAAIEAAGIIAVAGPLLGVLASIAEILAGIAIVREAVLATKAYGSFGTLIAANFWKVKKALLTAAIAVGKFAVALGPYAAAIAAIAAVMSRVTVIANKQVAELRTKWEELGKEVGITEENLKDFAYTAERALAQILHIGNVDFSTFDKNIKDIAKFYGLTEKTVVEIGLQSGKLSDSQLENLKLVKEQLAVLDNERIERNKIAVQQHSGYQYCIDKVAAEKELTDELEKQKAIIEKKYQAALNEYEIIIQNAKTEKQVLQEQIDKYTPLIDASDKYNKDRLEALGILQARIDEINKAEIDAEKSKTERELAKIDKDAATAKRIADDKLKLEADTLAATLALEKKYSDMWFARENNDADNKKRLLDDEQANEIETAKKIAEDKIDGAKWLEEELLKIKKFYAEKKKKVDDDVADETAKTSNDLVTKIGGWANQSIDIIASVMTSSWEGLVDVATKVGSQLIALGLQVSMAWMGIAGAAVIAIMGIVDIFIAGFEQAEKLAKMEADLILETAALKLEVAKDTLDEEYKLEIENIERIEDKKLKSITKIKNDSINAFLALRSAEEILALKAAGVIEETTRERLEREIRDENAKSTTVEQNELNIERSIEQAKLDAIQANLAAAILAGDLALKNRLKDEEEIALYILSNIDDKLATAVAADNTETINTLNNELIIEDFRTQAAIDAKTAEDEAIAAKLLAENAYKTAVSKYEYEKATADKEIKKAEIEINKATAISDMPWYTSTKDKNRIKALYDGLYSTVSGITIPQPRVYAANGGIFGSQVGGTDVKLGEAGYDEAVIPLNDRFFNKLANAAKGSTTGTATAGTDNGDSTINIILDGKVIGTSTVDLINNRVLTIDSRSIR